MQNGMLHVHSEREPHAESVWLDAMGHLVYVSVKPWSLEIGTCEGGQVLVYVCASVLQIDRSIQPSMGVCSWSTNRPGGLLQLVTRHRGLDEASTRRGNHPLPAVFVCNLHFCATAAHPVKGSRSRVVPADLLAVTQVPTVA
jgi:hypothetical protein